jgi:hypothetical protein
LVSFVLLVSLGYPVSLVCWVDLVCFVYLPVKYDITGRTSQKEVLQIIKAHSEIFLNSANILAQLSLKLAQET